MSKNKFTYRKVYQTYKDYTNNMHCNNKLFLHFSPIQSQQDGQICLVLTEFPESTKLDLTKTLIQEQFTFINKIHVRNNSEIQCYFDSMTDLIELDQGKKYGAGNAFIRHFDQQSSVCDSEDGFQKHHGVFKNSSQTFESQTFNVLPSYKHIPSIMDDSNKNQIIYPKLLHHPKMEHLTSLENQIQELEHLRDELELFKDQIDWAKTGVTQFVSGESADECINGQADQNQKYQCNQKDCFQKVERDQKQEGEREIQSEKKTSGKQMMISLIEGAALTGILIGGFKLLKTFIG